MRNPTPHRLARRGGIWLLMWAVMTGMALEGVHRSLTALFRPLFAKLHIDALGLWLKGHSLWWLVPIAIVLTPVVAVAKVVEIWLLLHYVPVGIVAFILLKLIGVGMANIFINAYAERLLSIAWIAGRYASYVRIRDDLKMWIRGQSWYIRAAGLRARYVAWKTELKQRVTLIDFAARAAKMHRCCFGLAR